MLDIEVVTAPTDTATDIVSLVEMRRHLRVRTSNTTLDDIITEALDEIVADLHGPGGKLNRSIFQATYRMYLKDFPGLDENSDPLPILIPFPPLVSVDSIIIEDGSSPDNVVSTADYVVKSGVLVAEVHPVTAWPTVTAAPRAVSVTFTAGYTTYPANLKRLVKILVAHAVENPEATINEPRQMAVTRKVEFGVDYLMGNLRVPLSYDDWNQP